MNIVLIHNAYKRIIRLMIYAMSTWAATAQGGLHWHWSNPIPHGNMINAVLYHKGLMIELCEKGQIYSSVDLNQWQNYETLTFNSLRAGAFFGERFVAVGESGAVVYGDSLDELHFLQLETTDWLEGVAASAVRIVAVGDNGAIYTSTNAVNWQRSNPFSTWLRSVAFADGKFVTVGEAGFIASSADGLSWNSENSGVTQDLNAVNWINGTWVAVGEGGTFLTKDPLLGWRTGSLQSTNSLYAVAGSTNSTVVAGLDTLQFQDKGSWFDPTVSTNRNHAPVWTYTSALWDGSEFFVGGRSGLTVEGFMTNSTSPLSWIESNPSVRAWLWDVFRSADFYVSVGSAGAILTSENGIKWNAETVPDADRSSYLLGVGGNTNLLVAVGNGGTVLTSPNVSTNTLHRNPDGTYSVISVSLFGIQWFHTPVPTTRDLQGIVFGNGKFVACGGGGTILTSTDGKNWIERVSPVQTFLSGAASFSGGFVLTGEGGVILSSTDGITWTQSVSGTINWIYKVRNLGERLVAVGENGTILGSTNGVSWASQNSGSTTWLNDITLVGSTYYAAGTDGQVLLNAGRNTWVPAESITRKSLYGLSTNDGQLVGVGTEGAVLRSHPAPFKDPIQIVDFAATSRGVLFLFSGEPDQRFELQESDDPAGGWTTVKSFEISEADGTVVKEVFLNKQSAQYFRTLNIP